MVTASPKGFMVTSTIVSGEKDALLIDAQFTLADAKKVAERVAAGNKTLTTDDANNSYVWIPSLKTVVAGDIVYDAVFPWTAETTPESRKAWSGTLDRLSAMQPERLVPGHQKPEQKQDPASLTFTKEYLAAYDVALAGSKTAAELEQKMKAKYPNAALDVVVKIGAEAAFKKPGATAEPKGSEPKTTEPKSPGAP